MTLPEHVDVLVVGAGLSGIGAACRLSVEHPGRTVAVLEARGASGGTWDIFRYPGIRYLGIRCPGISHSEGRGPGGRGQGGGGFAGGGACA